VSTLEQLEKLRSILNDQKRDLTALTNSVRTLSETISENRKEIDRLTQELAKAREGIQILSEDREKLTKKVEELLGQVASGEPIFNNSIAKLLYQLAKSLG